MDRSRLLTPLLALACLALAGPAIARMYEQPQSIAQGLRSLADVPEVRMPPVDVGKLKEEDAQRTKSHDPPGPYRFAFGIDVDLNTQNEGRWEGLPDGSRLWRLKIVSPGALSLNLGITRFDIPEGVKLWIYDRSAEYVEGPYTAKHRTGPGELWTPIIPGDVIVVELWIPVGVSSEPMVTIGRVNHGYRNFSGADKSNGDEQGACNIDVVCPAGNPWRDQIRAVAKYTIEGSSYCTGQLINNTNEDLVPYVLSAYHCAVTDLNDHTLVFFWNFESPNCGDLRGGGLSDNQGGATYRAGWRDSDFLLLELDTQPDPDFNVYYVGWNATGIPPGAAVSIHHPGGFEKAISFENAPLTSTAYHYDTPDPSANHWRVGDWDAGTTEDGSSGACLYDPADKLCIGQLHGGPAACGNDEPDWYGKVSASWNGGGTADTRLRDWLNPANDGTLTLSGIEGAPGSGPRMRIAETVLDYGEVELGFASIKPIVIYNDGDAALTVSVTNTSGGDADLPQWSDINEVSAAMVPVGTEPLILPQTYEPNAVGDHEIQLRVISNDPANQGATFVTLRGRGGLPSPIDTVLVLDRSGSMSETAGDRTKIRAMRDAADLYTHLLRADIGDTGIGDKIGYVKYNHRNSIYLSLNYIDDPSGEDSHTASAEDKLTDDALTDPARLEPSGNTGIGGAMETAAGMFSLPAGDRKHVMVVLTDGIENAPPYISAVIGPIQAADPDLSLYSVGVGNNIDPTKLQSITNVGNGYHQVANELSGVSIFDLETFYFKIFSHATGMDLVVDPTFAVPIVGAEPIVVETARITSSDRQATFLVLEAPSSRKLYELDLLAPNGDIIGPGSMIGGVTVHYKARNTYRIIKAVLPDAASDTDYLGDWKLRLNPKGQEEPDPPTSSATTTAISASAHPTLPIGFAVAVKSNFRMHTEVLPAGYLPGAAVTLAATLTDRGWPASSGRVSVDVVGPAGKQPARVQLYDDGTGLDQEAGDGTWTGVFVTTGAAGNYRFTFRATGRNHFNEVVPREATRFVTLMQPSPDPVAGILECIPCTWLWAFIVLTFVLLIATFLLVLTK